ncbi:MAG: CPBP family intramembrane glutamic endopeptidase [Terriglobales bacterium]|jgi:membrane protease YdiL (CAAX protease family)
MPSGALSAAHLLKIVGNLSIFTFCAVVLILWKRAHIDPRKPLGLVVDRKMAIEFCVGTLIGALAMLGTASIESALGLFQVKTFSLSGHHILKSASSYLITGFFEELIFRGLFLSGLVMLVRQRWLAVGLMAAIFGGLHGANPHATTLSVFSIALGGMVYAEAYLGSKRLWLGTGIHFAWNFVQGPVLGFAVSGGVMPWGGLFTGSVNGPNWVTGGSFGPEGGLICIGFRVVAAALILVWFHLSNYLNPRRFPRHRLIQADRPEG